MAYEQKPGSGAIFTNKKTKDTQPDLRGDFTTPDGKKYSISLWAKEGKSETFYSAKVEDFKERAEKPVEVPDAKPFDGEEDFPF